MTEEVFRVFAPAHVFDNSKDVDIEIPPRHALLLVSHDCHPVEVPLPPNATEVKIERIANPTPEALSLMPFVLFSVPVQVVDRCLGMSRDMANGIVRDIVAMDAARGARNDAG